MIVLPVSKFCLDLSNSNPICSSNLSYVQDVEVEGGDSSAASADKGTTVEGMGAGPLLPARGIHGIFKALVPFVKKLKQPKHLDALQNEGDVEVDINLICDAARGNGFKFGIDGSIDVEEGKSVSCCLAVVFNHVICRWGCWLGAPHHQESSCDVYASLDGGTPTTLLHTCHSNSFFSPLVPLIITLLVYNFTGNL